MIFKIVSSVCFCFTLILKFVLPHAVRMCKWTILLSVMKCPVLMLVGGGAAGTDGFYLSCACLTCGGLKEGLWGTQWTLKPI